MEDIDIPVSRIKRRWLRRLVIVLSYPLIVLTMLPLVAFGALRWLVRANVGLAKSAAAQWK